MIPHGSVLPTQHIRRYCLQYREFGLAKPLISPFCERERTGGVSHGLGSATYDPRIDREITLWPGRSVRANAIEEFCIPDFIVGIILSKSTWSRVHVEHAGNLIDPGFEGPLELEINMHYGHDLITIPAGAGVLQIMFLYLAEPTEQPYGPNDKYFRQPRNQPAIFS